MDGVAAVAASWGWGGWQDNAVRSTLRGDRAPGYCCFLGGILNVGAGVGASGGNVVTDPPSRGTAAHFELVENFGSKDFATCSSILVLVSGDWCVLRS